MPCKQSSVYFSRHTFGADKDRFKNSIFGRLDLAAEIPGERVLMIVESRVNSSSTELSQHPDAMMISSATASTTAEVERRRALRLPAEGPGVTDCTVILATIRLFVSMSICL